MKTRNRSDAAEKKGKDSQQLNVEDEAHNYSNTKHDGSNSLLSPALPITSNHAIPFFPQVDDQKPILSHLHPEGASSSDEKHVESRDVEILSVEKKTIAKVNSIQNTCHREENGEDFDLLEASDLKVGHVEEQTNLPLPEEQLKKFLQCGDTTAGDGGGKQKGAGSNAIQRYCAIDSQWYEAWNAYVKDPTKFSPPTRPFFHSRLAGIGGQLKFEVEERIHYEIVTEEQFDLLNGWYNTSPFVRNAESEEASSNFSCAQGQPKSNKIIGYKFFADGQIEWRPCRFNVYQSNPEIFVQEKYHRIVHDEVFSADMALKDFVVYLKESFLNIHNVAFDYRLWIRRTDFSRDDNKVFIDDVAATENLSENVNTTSYVESNWVLISLPKFHIKSDAENSHDVGCSIRDHAIQNPQTRLYEVCKQLISVDEDVCKLQNEYPVPIFEILIECWKPRTLTSIDEKNSFFEGKICSLKADINDYLKRSKDQPDVAPKFVRISRLWSTSRIIHSAAVKRLSLYQKAATRKDFDFKNEIEFVSEIYTKNDLREKAEGVYYVDRGFQYKNGDYVAIMIKGKTMFRKIVQMKRMIVYDRFADKIKECTCLKVGVLDLVKYFEDFPCHENDGYFEIYGENIKVSLSQKDQEELEEFKVHYTGTENDSTDLELSNFFQPPGRNDDNLLDNISVGEGQGNAHDGSASSSQDSLILKCNPQGTDPGNKQTQDHGAGVANTALTINDKVDVSSSEENIASSSLDDTPIFHDQKTSNGSSASSSRPYFDWNRVIRKAEKSGYGEFPGVCGLTNLGNTCFMNSMLQCLSNTDVLTTHFISRKFKDDINEENVLGTQGAMASKFYQLIKQMWKGTNSFISPTDLKYLIGRIQPQFRGYRQHDAQELCTFLLDALHEDLNKIKRKPYIEEKDPIPGTPDVSIAEDAWKNFLSRNSSFIIDQFYGQLRSHITCNECGFEAVKFDPFSCLSVPIPKDLSIRIPYVYVTFDGCSDTMKLENLSIEYDNATTVMALLEEVRKTICCNAIYTVDFTSLNLHNLSCMHLYAMDENGKLKSRYGACKSLIEMYNDVFKNRYNSLDSLIVFVRDKNFDESRIDFACREGVTKFLNTREREGHFVSSAPASELCKQTKELFRDLSTDLYTPVESLIGHTMRKFETHKENGVRASVMFKARNIQALHWVSKLVDNQLVRIQVVHRVRKKSHNFYRGATNRHNILSNEMNCQSIGYKSSYIDDYNVLQNTWFMLEYTQTTLATVAKSIHRRIASSPWQEHLRINGSRPNCSNDDNPHKRRKKTQGTSPQNTSPHREKIGDQEPPNSINPLDNDYYSLEIITPRHLRNTFEFVDFGREDGENLHDIINGHNEDDGGPFLGQKARRCAEDIVDTVVFVTWNDHTSHDSLMSTRHGGISLLKDHFDILNKDAGVRSDGIARGLMQNDRDKSDGKVTLYNCLEQFSKREQLSENDKYYCKKCKKHVRAFKKLDIWKAPKILIIQLKRFEYILHDSYYGNQHAERNKIEDEVLFPTGHGTNGSLGEKLDLSHFIKCPSKHTSDGLSAKYELFAVSEHSGTLGGGHYTASGRNFLNNKWYRFNDSQVRVLSTGPEEIDTSNAYVLFYRRCDGTSIENDHVSRARRTTLSEEKSVQDESDSFAETNSPEGARSSQGSNEMEDNEDIRNGEVDIDLEDERELESPECTGVKRRYPGSAVISI